MAARKKHLALKEEIPVRAQVRADDELLGSNLSADIAHLEGELVWAKYARDRVTWLLSQNAIWPSMHERSRATTEEARERREARTELFGRIAAKQNPAAERGQTPWCPGRFCARRAASSGRRSGSGAPVMLRLERISKRYRSPTESGSRWTTSRMSSIVARSWGLRPERLGQDDPPADRCRSA